jgi:hypothetical protein
MACSVPVPPGRPVAALIAMGTRSLPVGRGGGCRGLIKPGCAASAALVAGEGAHRSMGLTLTCVWLALSAVS